MLDVCWGLHQRGHQVTLLYVQEGDLLPEYRKFCQKLIQVQDFKICFNTRMTPKLLLQLLRDSLKCASIKADLVYIHQYHDSLFAALLAGLKRIPLVCHLRHTIPFRLYRKWKIGLDRVKQFIAVSGQTRQDWAAEGIAPDKIAVVYNGIDPTLFAPATDRESLRQQWGITEPNRVIAYAGRLDNTKGLEVLIKAFALLTEQAPQHRLLIAGKAYVSGQKYQRSLEQLVASLGLDDRVCFLGHLENPIPLYQLSDVTVLPSIESEPFGRSVIESMACGTPALGSRTGGIPEILSGEFAPFLFEANHPEALAQALLQVSAWQETDPQLGQRCRSHVMQHFTIEKTVDGIEQILTQLAGKG